MRHDPAAEQAVQERGGVVAEEQVAIDVRELAVEQVVRPQQRDDALEVAVGHVGRVEADQRPADGQRAAGRPALPPHARQLLPRRPRPARAARRAHPDVEADEHGDAEPDEPEVQGRDVVGDVFMLVY